MSSVGRAIAPSSAGAIALAVALALSISAAPAHAWILHEHTRIGHEAVQSLSAADRASLERAWALARGGAAERLCRSLAAGPDPLVHEGRPPRECIPFASLPALAGDHSCSPRELGRAVAERGWILDVLEVANGSTRSLAPDVIDEAARLDAWHDQHIELQFADQDYLTRAAGNDAHFQIERHSTDVEGYVARAVTTGQPINATALWVAYHVTALALARRAAHECTTDACRGPYLWRALLAESFALHFLQDSFSSGHIVGTWGGAAQRKGTHDYYSRRGVAVETWMRRSCATRQVRCTPEEIAASEYVAHGDAFLGPDDTVHAALAAARSLAQLARVLAAPRGVLPPGMPLSDAVPYESVDACAMSLVPLALEPYASAPFVRDVLELQPMPATRVPAMPRFRDEMGAFVMASLRFDGDARIVALDDAGGDAFRPAPLLRLRAGVGGGIGVSDVLDRFSDATASLEMIVSAERYEDRQTIGLGATLRLPFGPFWLADLGYWLLRGPLEGADFLHAFRTAAGGGIVGGWERRRVVGANVAYQLYFGRQATVVHYWLPPQDPAGRHRWEVIVPFFEIVLGRERTGVLASDLGAELSLWASFAEHETTFGASATLLGRTRVYP